ncbi:hypothetical protein [Alkaliphilus transvaalensis]|uniref:hypothetical protein n=1 Tax=Alkaliphilus transvaalensis TaxID=114628 RepID=UPI0004798916|nr:hypothetical protein [Alkaliphilus transvaalensis]
MEGLAILFFIIIGVFIYTIMQLEGYQKKIHNHIESIGGKVVSIEKRGMFSGIGPFSIVGKNRTIYRILYIKGDRQKEGWVRFGGLMGPDWRL